MRRQAFAMICRRIRGFILFIILYHRLAPVATCLGRFTAVSVVLQLPLKGLK